MGWVVLDDGVAGRGFVSVLCGGPLGWRGGRVRVWSCVLLWGAGVWAEVEFELFVSCGF